MHKYKVADDKVVIRPATPNDFEGIVRMSQGLYDGYDILPGTYFSCLENPNRCALVAEWNGEIVAFNAVLVVDVGRTAIIQYSRSAKKIRGKGIFRQLLYRQFPEFVYPKFPRVKRLRANSTNTDFFDKRKDGTTIDMTRMIVCFTDEPVPHKNFLRLLSPQRMAALRQQLPIDSLSPVNGNTLNNILADPVSRKQLFPEGFIAFNSETYEAHETNTCMVMQSCVACFVSGSASSTYTSISFGHVYSCLIGRVYDIDYYGPKDDSLILAHISRHLPLALEIWRKEPVTFTLNLKETCFGTDTKRRLHEFAAANIAPGGQPPRYMKLYSLGIAPLVPNSNSDF